MSGLVTFYLWLGILFLWIAGGIMYLLGYQIAVPIGQYITAGLLLLVAAILAGNKL